MDRRHFLNTAFLSIWCCLSAVCFLYRVIVKQTFGYYFHEKNDVKLIRVIIYGTDTINFCCFNRLKFEIPVVLKSLDLDKTTK
jgi:hypothetical protein